MADEQKTKQRLEIAQESACWYLKVDPIYDSLRKEPRFQALVEKIFHETQ